MLKWLLVIALVAAVYFFFIKKKPLPNENRPKNRDKKKPDEADMVECEKCGTYVSLGEALLKDGKYFCSSECMKG